MDSDTGFSSIYIESRWSHDDSGEDITDGYGYRGKRTFDRALEGLKTTLEKGYQDEVNGVKFKVLDKRKKGVELEIEIGMVEGKNKGNAMVKLYGLNKRKENVVLVTKSKGNDSLFVEILAHKVIKPVMNAFLKGNPEKILNLKNKSKTAVTVGGKEITPNKCSHCEKTSFSIPGLKSHITKMHHDVLRTKEKPDKKTYERKEIDEVL